MQIAICDDDKRMCSNIETAILEYSKAYQVVVSIAIYYTGKSLCKDLDKGEYYDLIFLDIELSDASSGVEIGYYIREKMKNEAMQIVYISSHKKYALELFKVRPMDFLIKPITKEMVRTVIKLCMSLMKRTNVSFQYKQGRDLNKIFVKDILYF